MFRVCKHQACQELLSTLQWLVTASERLMGHFGMVVFVLGQAVGLDVIFSSPSVRNPCIWRAHLLVSFMAGSPVQVEQVGLSSEKARTHA